MISERDWPNIYVNFVTASQRMRGTPLQYNV